MAATVTILAGPVPQLMFHGVSYQSLPTFGGSSGRVYQWNETTDAFNHVATTTGSIGFSYMAVVAGILYAAAGPFGLYAWSGSGSSMPNLSASGNLLHVVNHGDILYGLFTSTNRIMQWTGTAWALVRSLSFQPTMGLSWNGSLYVLGNNGELFTVSASTETSLAPSVMSGGGFNFFPTLWNDQLYICLPQSLNDGSPRLYRWNGSNAWTAVANQHDSTCRNMSSLALWRNKLWGTAQNSNHVLSWDGALAAFVQEATATASTNQDSLVAIDGGLYHLSTSLSQIDRGPDRSSLLPSSTAKISHGRIVRGYRNDTTAKEFHDLMSGAL